MANVVIYSKEPCPYCVRAKQLFDKKKVAYDELRIDLKPELVAEMINRSSGRRTVPQIFINNKHIGGCDDLMALEMSGELDKLLTS